MKKKYIFLYISAFVLTSCSVAVKDVPKKQTKIEKKPSLPEKVITYKPERKEIITENKPNIEIEEKQILQKEANSLSIPIPEDEDIQKFIYEYAVNKKKFTEVALRRANYFLPLVKDIFSKYNIPEELSYLAVVESGYNPYATSISGAAGIWQFIPSTAKRYGLRIDDYVDERRDPVKSTIAAAKYLQYLYNYFGRWDLAIAAYNCGEKCILARLSTEKYKFTDIKYDLPDQTREYVPRFFALLLIAQNPEKYGLDIAGNKYEITTEIADREITLDEIAKKYKIDYEVLKFYNAHLKKEIALDGVNINIPKLMLAEFDKRYIYIPKYNNTQIVKENIKEQKQPIQLVSYSKDYKQHIVKEGETLYRISKIYNIDIEELKKVNNLTDNNISVGMVLKIPINSEQKISNIVFKENKKYITHIVKEGETLYRISKMYNTDIEEIKKLNNLSDNTISVGQVLKIPES